MGSAERQVKKRIRNTKIQSAVLQTVAFAGVLGVALLAPNTLQMIKVLDTAEQKKKRRSIDAARVRLIEKGLLKYDGKFLRLTKKGEMAVGRLEQKEYQLKKPRKWDGKWRVLIFDIPEHKKSTRDKVRYTLVSIGFKRLQNSVWVYPYDCEDLITLLKTDFKIGKDLLYLIVDYIENDRLLRKYFDLHK